jgi:hypothetical protein
MHAANDGPGGLALGELQHLVLVAAMRVSSLQPEALEPHDLAPAALGLHEALADVYASLAVEIDGPVGDVAAVARWELRRLLETLHGLSVSGATALDLARLGAARQSALGALDGLERALVEDGGLAPVLGGVMLVETRRALAMRAVFVGLRDEVRALGDPPIDALREPLARVARRLEAMRDARGLRRLRVGDRLQVESLLERIATALGSGRASEGAGVWRDVVSYAEVLLEVNRRAELRAHDHALSQHLARELAARPGVLAQLAFRRRLEALRGRDDALDRLLDEGGDAARVLARLEAIAAAAA